MASLCHLSLQTSTILILVVEFDSYFTEKIEAIRRMPPCPTSILSHLLVPRHSGLFTLQWMKQLCSSQIWTSSSMHQILFLLILWRHHWGDFLLPLLCSCPFSLYCIILISMQPCWISSTSHSNYQLLFLHLKNFSGFCLHHSNKCLCQG